MVVHVLSEKSNRRLCTVFFDERHVEVVHKVNQSLGAGRSVRLAAPLRKKKEKIKKKDVGGHGKRVFWGN